MVLESKETEELWKLLHGLRQFTPGPVVDSTKHDIYAEVIRREKDE